MFAIVTISDGTGAEMGKLFNVVTCGLGKTERLCGI
jgi:hypothetical protein